MKILKKILAIAIILGMFGQVIINSVLAYEDSTGEYINTMVVQYSDNYKNRVIKGLKNIKNGKKYILQIDKFISKISDGKAEKLEIKIENLREAKEIKEGSKLDLIVSYIEIKLKDKKMLSCELEQQAKKEIFNNTLSDIDTKKVNDELVKIQKNLLKQGVSSFEKILGELETYTNFEEKGNFEAKFNMDMEDFGKSKASLKLKDYISKSSGFDAQFKTKIEAIIEATPKGKDEVKMEINAFIDYIVKDQNYYVLLKNLKIVDEKDILKLDSKIQKIKEIAAKNKYIKIEDKNTAQIISQLKQFSPENILKQGNSIVSKPLFTAYKKEGNKFYLIPSKYGCDTAKTLAKKFDPFNGNTCTDSQYQDLLDDIADSKTEFYMDFSSRNTVIGFEANPDDMDIVKGDITFSDKYIEEINFIIKPNQENYPGEGASLNFVKAKKLDAKIYANSGKANLNLKSTLDGANRFKTIDFSYKIDDKLSSELILKNRKITGSYSNEGYNSKMVGIISGKTNTSNRLDTLKISNQYINSSSWNPGETNTVLEYSYGKYSIDNKYESEGTVADLKASFKISRDILSELNFDLNVSEKKSSYDENYNKTYTGSFMKVVDSNIELKNKNIKGNTVIFDKDKEIIKITNTGRYEEDKFELNTRIDVLNQGIDTYSKGFNSKGGNISPKKVEANFNIKADTGSNKNNFNIYADIKLDDKKIIDIELDNKSKKTYKNIKILAPLPNDTIPLEEVFENPNMY